MDKFFEKMVNSAMSLPRTPLPTPPKCPSTPTLLTEPQTCDEDTKMETIDSVPDSNVPSSEL